MQCLVEEHDYDYIAPILFSTTQAGLAAPSLGGKTGVLQQANSFAAWKALDIIVTCRGEDDTSEIYSKRHTIEGIEKNIQYYNKLLNGEWYK